MNYIRKQLRQAVQTILKDYNEMYFQSAGLPTQVDDACAVCFVKMIPESDQTRIIREAYIDIHEKEGFFNFKEE